MFYVDCQRTVTRRDSSLIVNKKQGGGLDVDFDTWSTTQGQSTLPFTSESTGSVAPRARGSVQKELITMMFESMLDSIVDTWDIIIPLKPDESSPAIDFGKTNSELTFASKKKKNLAKISRTRQGRSRLEMDPSQAGQACWWSAPDEKAIIKFKNGNLYEGNISMKCMHGEGRYQWADGTVYLGQFNDNEIRGKGMIQWKDDTWYEGEFAGNLRHGKGLYVDSRSQRSYAGGWHYGTKHGEGVIYYSNTFKNSYDGHWIYNERFGYGSREYCELSGYKGEWERNVREGKGLMIWPNHDFYRGEWKNGVMSGYGIYIWDACYNNTMALPSINAFRGTWERGQRHGYGVLNLGLGLGSHYKGEFKNNKKHGVGKFVTNNGLILQDKNLFIDDNLGPKTGANELRFSQESKSKHIPLYMSLEPYNFQICDRTVGLIYHIDQALKNIDKQAEIRANIVSEYIEKNKNVEWDMSLVFRKEENAEEEVGAEQFDDMIVFEENSLRKALRCYETELLHIYYKYATICNTHEIGFSPVMTRLFLWQLYYDCNVHERGLTLVEIDNIFHQNPEWLAANPHNPFEKIYLWQFIHSLISVACRLYAKRQLPETRPDTILASAFRRFMDCDVIPGSTQQRGRLVNGFGSYVPLKATYDLYRTLGEPHTVRQFLRAVRRSPHCVDRPQPPLVEGIDVTLPLGRNVYIFGDELTFVVDDNKLPEIQENKEEVDLKLFNFGNLSSKTVIKIFSKIFPQLSENDKIMNLEIELTFFEFFEAFVACAEESIRVKDEELKWRERFHVSNDTSVPPSTPATTHGLSHGPSAHGPTPHGSAAHGHAAHGHAAHGHAAHGHAAHGPAAHLPKEGKTK